MKPRNFEEASEMKKPTVEEWMEHAEKHTAHTAFHWPDHTIGKRESRAIREAHNALYNDFHRLKEINKELVGALGRIVGGETK